MQIPLLKFRVMQNNLKIMEQRRGKNDKNSKDPRKYQQQNLYC